MLWGKLKDYFMENQDTYATDEFQVLYTSSLNVNWPYRECDCFVFEGNEVRISEAFETHIRTQTNWSMDHLFAQRYPELGAFCKFTDYAPLRMEGEFMA